MKINKTLFFLASVLASTPLFASEEAKPEIPAAAEAAVAADAAAPEGKLDFIEQNGQKFILVVSLSTAAANDEFSKNVGVMNQLRQTLITLNEHKKIAFTDEEKKATDAKINELTEELKKADQTMAKAYGYSISRDYINMPVEMALYLKLTDEEYEAAKKNPEVKAETDLLVKGDDKFQRVSVIRPERACAEFQLNVQKMIALRNRLMQMDKALAKMPEGKEKDAFKEEFEKGKAALDENNKKMVETYGYSVARSYYMEIVKAKLYVKVNEEEFLKAQKAAEEEALRAEAKSAIADEAK